MSLVESLSAQLGNLVDTIMLGTPVRWVASVFSAALDFAVVILSYSFLSKQFFFLYPQLVTPTNHDGHAGCSTLSPSPTRTLQRTQVSIYSSATSQPLLALPQRVSHREETNKGS